MYLPLFYCGNYYYFPMPYSPQYSPYKRQIYFRNQGYYLPYITNPYDKSFYFRQPDTLEIPDNAKVTKLFPIGGEFFIPEFKIAQCDTNRAGRYSKYTRGFKISMNQVKKEFKNAESSVKEAAKKALDELNKLIGNNDAEIKKVLQEIKEKWRYLAQELDCPPNRRDTSSDLPDPYNRPEIYEILNKFESCQTSKSQEVMREIRELQKKLKELKSKKNFWGTLDSSRVTFQDNLKKLAQSEIPSINWPKSWPTLEDIEYMPVVAQQHLDLPRTLKDMNISSSLIQDIAVPNNIRDMINVPSDLDIDVDLDLKNQIQFDDAFHSAEQVLQDIANKAIQQLQQYNMCFFIKNSPYTLEIKLQYISNLRTLIESYIFGCLEKAKKAAIVVFIGYMPGIVSSYGATIPVAISNVFATYWTTLKKCLFDVYNTIQQHIQDIEGLGDVQNFEEFLQIIEKYVSIDLTLEKRTVPWENKGSLLDLVTNVTRNTGSLPFIIEPQNEYIQSPPQFTPTIKHFTIDKESLKKIINKCGRHGMWIFVTLKNPDSQGFIMHALNFNSFENDILSGYKVNRTANGDKVKEVLSIPINNIRNIECYNPSTDSKDNKKDLLVKSYDKNFCSVNRGTFFGKDYIDMGNGIIIYFEVYECGVYTIIYIDGELKSQLYLPRFSEEVKHKYKHSTSQTSSIGIELDINKVENELQQRLRIMITEYVLEEHNDFTFWKVKLPW